MQFRPWQHWWAHQQDILQWTWCSWMLTHEHQCRAATWPDWHASGVTHLQLDDALYQHDQCGWNPHGGHCWWWHWPKPAEDSTGKGKGKGKGKGSFTLKTCSLLTLVYTFFNNFSVLFQPCTKKKSKEERKNGEMSLEWETVKVKRFWTQKDF